MTTIEFNYQLTSMESGLERFALSLTSNPDDARDLVQETFLKAILNREKFTDFSNLKAWVYTIMRNSFINNYRKSARQQTTLDNSADNYLLSNTMEATSWNPDSILYASEIHDQVTRLDDELRIPFQMFQEGYKYKEIAEKLNLKIGTVKSRIFFGRKELQQRIKR